MRANGQAPATVADALRLAVASLDFLNSPAGEVDGAGCGQVLAALGQIHARFTAAQASVLRRFDAADGHDGDGYPTSAAWLAAMAQMSRKDARATVQEMRRLAAYPGIREAMATGQISRSFGLEIIELVTRNLPAGLRGPTATILLDAAVAGASLDDLKVIAAAAAERWKAAHPDPDESGGFDDRGVRVETTFGGAGCIHGNLTAECATAVQAVLDALGKRQGPEDIRTEVQRWHDALQLGCELLIRANMIPDRAGADTHVSVHIGLGQLLAMPGGSAVEAAWLAGRAGEPGYLTGDDATTAACDALTIPVVTGHADMSVIDKIIDLVLAYVHGTADGHGDRDGGGPDGSDGDRDGDTSGDDSSNRRQGAESNRDSAKDGTDSGADGTDSADADPGAPGRPGALSAEAHAALRYAIARLATDFLSGPGGLASALRTNLLDAPYNSASLPLDIGYSENIPAHIRRAVILRDKHCAWPHCDRPVAWCDVHHIVHRKDGGKTSVTNCILLCQFHHDVCIHRWGWQIILHPDATTTARGPHGQILRSHAPPAGTAA